MLWGKKFYPIKNGVKMNKNSLKYTISKNEKTGIAYATIKNLRGTNADFSIGQLTVFLAEIESIHAALKYEMEKK